MSPPAPDPEEPAGKRPQWWWPALIAALATLLAALVSLLGVYMGTKLANEAQKDTVAAQSEQASRQYLRDQRRRAYADLLRANRQLLGVEQDLLRLEPVPEPRATELRRQAMVARRNYFGSIDLVKVVGPKALLTKISEILTRAHNAAFREIERQVSDPRETLAEDKRSLAAVKNAGRATDQIVLDFLSVVDAEK